MLDLEPNQTPGAGNGLEDRQVRSSDAQGARFPVVTPFPFRQKP
jgi:hypothetical protein